MFLSLLVLLMTNCGRKENNVVAELTTDFPAEIWDRLKTNDATGEVTSNFVSQKVDIQDTASDYEISLELRYSPNISEIQIPVVFSTFSPDGEEFHVHRAFSIRNLDKGNVKEVIYPKKHFNMPGVYTFQFFQKTSRFSLEGAKSVTLRVVKLKR